MKKKVNRFWKEKICTALDQGKATIFLDPLQYREISKIAKYRSYRVWEPFPDSEYKILYTQEKPDVTCFKVISEQPLTHPMIMGSLYALNIESGYIGDIVVAEESYVFVLSSLKDYIQHHLTQVGQYSVKLVEASTEILKTYQPSYQEEEILASSLRLDIILAKLAHTSRRVIKEKLEQEEVTLNYEVTRHGTTELRQDDIFSMRRLGKFKVLGTVGKTKKGNLVVRIARY